MENTILNAMRALTISVYIICALGVATTVFITADIVIEIIRSWKNETNSSKKN